MASRQLNGLSAAAISSLSAAHTKLENEDSRISDPTMQQIATSFSPIPVIDGTCDETDYETDDGTDNETDDDMDDDMSDDTDDDMDEEMKEEADNTPLIKLNWGERGKLLTEERVMIIRRALKMHLKMHTAPSDKEIRHMKTMFDLAESKSSPLPKPQCLVLPRSMTEYLARDRIPRAWKPPAWPPTVDQEEAESREDNNRDYDEDAEEDDEDFDSDADEEAIVGKGVVAQGLALNLKAHRIGLANATEEQKREFFKAKGRDLIRKAEDLIQRVKDEMI